MKVLYIIGVIVLMLTMSTSCGYFSRSSDTKRVFVVKSNSLNVRKSSNTKAKILGVLHKGDTIFPTRTFLYWVKFVYNDSIAYVSADYLTSVKIPNMKRVSNMKLGKTESFIRDYINEYINWRTWMFWAIAAGLFVVCLILISICKAIDNSWFWDDLSYGRMYNFSAFIGALFAVIYIGWREEFFQALFVTKFWWLPEGKEWIPWFLWSSSVLGAVGLLFFWIQDLVYYKFRGLFRSIIYTLVSIVTLVTAFYLGIVIVIFGAIMILLYILSIFTSGGYYPSESDQISKITSLFNQGYRGESLREKFLNWYDN